MLTVTCNINLVPRASYLFDIGKAAKNKGPEKAFQDEHFSAKQYFFGFTTFVGIIITAAIIGRKMK